MNTLQSFTRRTRPTRTPSLIQMEAVECGAASLGIILRHYGRIEPLEKLRIACGVSRDGANAAAILTAARDYGMSGVGKTMDLVDLAQVKHPVIVHWAFQHFMVLEGFRRTRHGIRVHVNDPATGPRVMMLDEFDSGFTGVVIDIAPGEKFKPGGRETRIVHAVWDRLRGMGGALSLTLLATALMVVPGVAAPMAQQHFIDEVTSGQNAGRYAAPAALAVCAITVVLLTAVQREHMLRVEARMALSSATDFMSDLLSKPVSFFQQRHAADLTGRVEANFRVSSSIATEIVLALASLSFVIVYGICLLVLDPILAIMAVSISALNIVLLRYVLRRQRDAAAAQRACDAGLASTTMQTLASIASVKGNGTEQSAFAAWAGYSAKVTTEGQRLGVGAALLSVLPTLLASVNTVVVLIVGGLRLSSAGAGIGTLMAFQALLVAFAAPLTQLVTQSGRLQVAQADLARLEDVRRYDSNIPDNQNQAVCDAVVLEGRLKFDRVSYSFSADIPWIRELSFEIPPGSSVALVGSSGSGKSTVGRLAAGLITPSAGRILVDEIERGAHHPQSLVAGIAFVDQNVTLYEGTVRDNVTLWDEAISEQAIVRALEDAEVFTEVARRAGGLNCAVSEGGSNFSGGQRQRLEIARALASEPALLILDEATSACDVVTEARIMRNLRRRGCSMLIIAHRMSTIRDADHILVLDRGDVVESGTHEELLERAGLYRELLMQRDEKLEVAI